ncbi:Mg-dependent DNase [Viridothelium virens]|uniref:Mg-dependent DNase n=1 Tax=Viridothelium virens TaxID=1048519 RepID=A0A6A6H068_VIRVR|nr:Mg-dependent DNase [Viridothelium virens]
MVTGSDLKESEHAVEIAKAHPGLCYATIGVHPCSASQLASHPSGGSAAYLSSLRQLAESSRSAGHAVAFGEIGLDYDRLSLCPKETQLQVFDQQLDLAAELDLPLFLHMRAAMEDFERILRKGDAHEDGGEGNAGGGGGAGAGGAMGRWAKLRRRRGLVHSFTGTLEEMQRVVAMGFDVGVNGCSMKTEENVAVVREVPLERLQIETDGPWCEMRPSHASAAFLKDAPPLPKAVKKEKWTKEWMVKGRNEPCAITQVAWAVAKIKGVGVEEVCEAAWNNSIRIFGLGEEPTS